MKATRVFVILLEPVQLYNPGTMISVVVCAGTIVQAEYDSEWGGVWIFSGDFLNHFTKEGVQNVISRL